MRNREISLPSGDVLPPEDSANIEELFKRQEIEESEKDPRLETILQKIDLDVLKVIFLDYAKKAGLEPDDVNLLGLDRIKHKTWDSTMNGQYNSLKNLAALNYDNIASAAGQPDNVRFQTLQTLVHEQTHAVSRNIVLAFVIKRMGRIDISVTDCKSGYGNNDIFTAFNEGVVEKLSREITQRYIQADPKFKAADEARVQLSYEPEVAIVEAIITKISEDVGISAETVWGAIIRGLIEGTNFADSELKQEFDSTFGPRFVEKLGGRTPYQEDFGRLMDQISGYRLKRLFKRLINDERSLPGQFFTKAA